MKQKGYKKKASKRLTVETIGITGSFGKTSTKLFLETILSKKYLVSKTPKSYKHSYGNIEKLLIVQTSH